MMPRLAPLLLPLAGEGGPTKSGRMRDDAARAALGGSLMVVHRPPRQLSRARAMRSEPSKAEELLWKCRRDRRINLKIRRQVPIGPYIADFACLTAKLVVELDGPPHDKPEQQAFDERRDAWLASHGWRVLRLPNEIVFVGGDIALNKIKSLLPGVPSSDPTSSGHLLPQAGEGEREADR